MEFMIEGPDDYLEVENLLDLSFAPGRQNLSSYRLREGVEPVREICMICRDEGLALIGAIRYWPVRVATYPLLLLGPVAVHPTAQGMGIAALLIRETLALAKKNDWERVILIGDAPYYGRFGFERKYTLALDFPPPTNPDRFLGLPLKESAFDGIKGLVERIN